PFESDRAEEGAQDRAAVVGLGEQEALEPVLGQKNHLQELVLFEREDAAELVTDIDRARGDGPPARIGPVPGNTVVTDLEPRVGLRHGCAAAPLLGPLVTGRAVDAVVALAEAELELHEAGVSLLAVVTAQLG